MEPRYGIMISQRGACVLAGVDPANRQQNAFIEPFNGSLRDEQLNEESCDTLGVPAAAGVASALVV